jgi:hypothetical protein
MRQSLAPFSGPESSPQTRSLADFIATTSGFRFSVHTAPAIMPAGMMGDRAAVIFAAPEEITKMIEPRC